MALICQRRGKSVTFIKLQPGNIKYSLFSTVAQYLASKVLPLSVIALKQN